MLNFFIIFTLLTTQLWAKGSFIIEDVIQDYFQGYQQADTSLTHNAFHTDTRLLSGNN